MFDLDKWQEIWHTLRRNRLRTFLTAAGVFWGIFMLIVMLGMGTGLQRGAYRNMGGSATNAIYLWGNQTSLPYHGFLPGRGIQLVNADIALVRDRVAGIQELAPRCEIGGFRSGAGVVRGNKHGNYRVTGDFPSLFRVETVVLDRGRLLDPLDLAESRKVAVIGKRVHEELFEPDEDPIGQHVRVQGVYFQVVGVVHSRATGDDGDQQSGTVYTPFTTFQRAFHFGDRLGWLTVTALPHLSASAVEDEIRAVLGRAHTIAPEDRQAIGSWNAEREFKKVQSLFFGIRWFIWFVGVCTLFAGVVGVSNIMLIAVKERTKELGVRKALGATPASVISLVIQESVALTSLAGYAGVVAGVGVLELVSGFVDRAGPGGIPYFSNPEVGIRIALIATAILIVSGCLAGIMPARHAARINPVEALRAD